MLFRVTYPERKHDVYCLGRHILNFKNPSLFKETPKGNRYTNSAKRNPLMNPFTKTHQVRKSTPMRKKDKNEEKVWSFVLIPGGMELFHSDVLLSGQQQNHCFLRHYCSWPCEFNDSKYHFKSWKYTVKGKKMSAGSAHDHGKYYSWLWGGFAISLYFLLSDTILDKCLAWCPN